MPFQYLITYLVLVNAIALVLMLMDKLKAKSGAFRIPESTLIGISVLGGSVGAITGMYLFHHKTRHLKFKLGLPMILIIQLVAIFLLFQNL